jgi:hypothetical protein
MDMRIGKCGFRVYFYVPWETLNIEQKLDSVGSVPRLPWMDVFSWCDARPAEIPKLCFLLCKM